MLVSVSLVVIVIGMVMIAGMAIVVVAMFAHSIPPWRLLIIAIIIRSFFLRQGSNELDSLPITQPKPRSAANQTRTQANRSPRQGDSPRLPANRGWFGSSHCA